MVYFLNISWSATSFKLYLPYKHDIANDTWKNVHVVIEDQGA